MPAHFQRAQLLYQQHRFDLAEKELALALAEEPNQAPAHALLALCLVKREQFDEATGHAQVAVGLRPDEPWHYYALAWVWFGREHYEKAEQAIREAIALDPADADYHDLLARTFFMRDRWEEALASSRQALVLDPQHVDALNLQAICLKRLGRVTDAEGDLLHALQVDPDNPATHANLGWTRLQKGDRKQAETHFREALRLNPNLEWARKGVVETLKAYNPLYRPLLMYFFAMQRLTRRGQMMVIFGAYFLYVTLDQYATAHPAVRPWASPLLYAYLVFAAASWLGQPLMNLTLRLHPFGRLALSRDERTASGWIGGFLVGAIGLWLLYWLLLPADVVWRLALVATLMIMPLAGTFSSAKPYPRKPMVLYTTAVGGLGLAFVLAALFPPKQPLALAVCGALLGLVGGYGCIGGACLSWIVASLLGLKRQKK